jgi:glucosamine--fructose-6-phosphate aminotransferase (isomerizing)
MCGIVGYVGQRDTAPLLLESLQRLEYRGYDSAGIAVVQDGAIHRRRSAGKLVNLASALATSPLSGRIGIGHTRWATHGRPSEENAHPHTDCSGDIVLIHNGIIENYVSLKTELLSLGHVFASETDSEVLVHLIEQEYCPAGGRSLADATRRALDRVKGAHAAVVMSLREPDRLVAARLGNAGGLVVGKGDHEMFLASDMPAILQYTREMYFLGSREMAEVTQDGVVFSDLDGRLLAKSPQTVSWDPISAAKGGYKHFMLKEIHEQASSLSDTIAGRLDPGRGDVRLEHVAMSADQISRVNKIVLVACGTAWHAALVGKFMIERLARMPVEVDYASEFRYRDPLVSEDSLVVAVTQSGETVDTLAALEEARAKGARLMGIVNVVGSMASRVCDDVIYTHAGPEIGVASTKAFTSQLCALYMLAVYLGRRRGNVDLASGQRLVADLQDMPDLLGRVLARDGGYAHLAALYHHRSDFLYLGRGIQYPIALEGALKLKEISYIHAEGYPAGEMKHGPIALIDERMPVVALVPRDHVYEKMVSQVEQVKARGGVVIAVATDGDAAILNKADHVIYVPSAAPLLEPLLTAIPMQLLAYHLAVRRGCDVDQPRNLAKSVTVE